MVEERLIFLKGEEKTTQVEDTIEGEPVWKIIFKSNINKEYTYPAGDVEVYNLVGELKADKFVVNLSGVPQRNIKRVLDYGEKVVLFYTNGFRKVVDKKDYGAEEVVSDESIGIKLNFLREIAEARGDDNADENLKNYLLKQYDKINYVKRDSALYSYLSMEDIYKRVKPEKIIFPFSFNLSQREAVVRSFENSIFIIEGPPGTGKTQTILNIIANAVINNKTVAVVSNNNSAIENVLEKLKMNDFGFFAALLGKKQNREVFAEQETVLPEDFENWHMDTQMKRELESSLNSINGKMIKTLKMENRLAECEEELYATRLEKKYFDMYLKSCDYKALGKLSLMGMSHKRVVKFLVENEMDFSEQQKLSFIKKLKIFVKYGINKFEDIETQGLNFILGFQECYYISKIAKFEADIKRLRKRLAGLSSKELRKEHQAVSERIFKGLLHRKYSGEATKYELFDKRNYWQKYDEFIKYYPVVVSTTHAILSSTVNNYMFDYVIIDESSQVDLVTAGIAMSCARNLIVVGDTKQLPHIVASGQKKVIERIIQKYGVQDCYNYITRNIISSLNELYKDRVPSTTLREHYRCHPQIIGFCNKKFYDGQLIPVHRSSSDISPLMHIKTAEGHHMRAFTEGGKINVREIDEAKVCLKHIPENCRDDVGFISPFRKQADRGRKELGEDIEADTVHKFQGREKCVIIFSTVISDTRQGMEVFNFVDNSQLVNVALSRAVEKFLLVSDGKVFLKKHNTNIGDLTRYIDYNCPENVKSGEVVSIFDMLYKDFSSKLLKAKSKIESNSKYKSENLMQYIIEEVLGKDKFSSFKFVHQVRLRELVPASIDKSERERRFVNHHRASVDFVIYNKFDNSPALCIEVDGFKYHENNPEQLERDRMKDRLLEVSGIPVSRFSTTGSREEERLEARLDEIINGRESY